MPKWLPYVALVTLSVLALSHYRRVEMPADAAVVAAAQAPAADHASVAVHAHWSYEGPEGPEHWGELDPAYAACAKGTHQTPIDIHDAADADLPPLAIDYKTLGQEVVNNGHTIQVNVAPGSTLTLNGVPYELKQFHFHTPSENDIDERPYAMEAHLVHGGQKRPPGRDCGPLPARRRGLRHRSCLRGRAPRRPTPARPSRPQSIPMTCFRRDGTTTPSPAP